MATSWYRTLAKILRFDPTKIFLFQLVQISNKYIPKNNRKPSITAMKNNNMISKASVPPTSGKGNIMPASKTNIEIYLQNNLQSVSHNEKW